MCNVEIAEFLEFLSVFFLVTYIILFRELHVNFYILTAGNAYFASSRRHDVFFLAYFRNSGAGTKS